MHISWMSIDSFGIVSLQSTRTDLDEHERFGFGMINNMPRRRRRRTENLPFLLFFFVLSIESSRGEDLPWTYWDRRRRTNIFQHWQNCRSMAFFPSLTSLHLHFECSLRSRDVPSRDRHRDIYLIYRSKDNCVDEKLFLTNEDQSTSIDVLIRRRVSIETIEGDKHWIVILFRLVIDYLTYDEKTVQCSTTRSTIVVKSFLYWLNNREWDWEKIVFRVERDGLHIFYFYC